MEKYPKMALISWALVWKYGFKRLYLNNNVRNQSKHNNVLYVFFITRQALFMTHISRHLKSTPKAWKGIFPRMPED